MSISGRLFMHMAHFFEFDNKKGRGDFLPWIKLFLENAIFII